MTAVGFEPTQLSLVELESTPSDHSGKLSLQREMFYISPGFQEPPPSTLPNTHGTRKLRTSCRPKFKHKPKYRIRNPRHVLGGADLGGIARLPPSLARVPLPRRTGPYLHWLERQEVRQLAWQRCRHMPPGAMESPTPGATSRRRHSHICRHHGAYAVIHSRVAAALCKCVGSAATGPTTFGMTCTWGRSS